jgi:MiaB-like tRNA modifying enzyme
MQEPEFIYFETYGCSANQNNTEIMKGLVRQVGLELTNNIDIADLLVLNTCIVKGPTEKKIERRISDLKKMNKPIVVAGCMPEVRSKRLRDKNLYLLGAHHVKDLPRLIRKIYEGRYKEQDFLSERKEEKLCMPKISQKKDVGITQISEGCIGNCSFCITKLAKGPLFSYPEDRIIKSIQNDLRAGAKEIWLTSQDNAAYGLDKGKNKLIELMTKILNLKGKFMVRLGMMNPENVLPILPELIKIYQHKKIKKFLHLPLQSGSDNILKKMNRKYSVKDFLKIVKKFRKEIKDLVLSTDIIVAYPGETEEDFEKTVDIIKQIKPQRLNLSRFWSMKGTEAEKMKQIPTEIAKKRTTKLMSIYKKIKQDMK